MKVRCLSSDRGLIVRIMEAELGERAVYYVSEKLVKDLLAHLPETVYEVLRVLYGREDGCSGLAFSREYIQLTGFHKGHKDEAHIHRQLADLIMKAARSKRWVKPFTANVRNRKYDFRTWLNSIGMVGPEYEEARGILLGRLYGCSGQRRIPRSRDCNKDCSIDT